MSSIRSTAERLEFRDETGGVRPPPPPTTQKMAKFSFRGGWTDLKNRDSTAPPKLLLHLFKLLKFLETVQKFSPKWVFLPIFCLFSLFFAFFFIFLLLFFLRFLYPLVRFFLNRGGGALEPHVKIWYSVYNNSFQCEHFQVYFLCSRKNLVFTRKTSTRNMISHIFM